MAATGTPASNDLQERLRSIVADVSPPTPPTPPLSSCDLPESKNPGSTEPQGEHHGRYYFQDSLVVFRVDGKIWKVHRHYFIRESPFFQSMFSLPQADQASEGDTDQKPIPLPGVKKEEFEILLDYFYEGPRFEQYLHDLATETAATIKAAANLSAQSGSGTGAAETSAGPRRGGKKRSPSSEPSAQEVRVEKIKYLLNLFSIANRYDFSQVRQYSVRAIEKLRVESGSGMDSVWTAVDRIEMADRFNVDEWLVPAYKELCLRPTSLAVKEGERIGGRKTAIIASVRESVRESMIQAYYGAQWVPDQNTVQNALQSTLASLNSAPVA